MNFPDAFEALDRLAALAVGPSGGVIMSADGEVEEFGSRDFRTAVRDKALLVCNAPVMSRRLGTPLPKSLDVLELFAFMRPARFCLPLASGLAKALGIASEDDSLEGQAFILLQSAKKLLEDLSHPDYPYREGLASTAYQMADAGWPWGQLILGALQAGEKPDVYQVWTHLPEWEESAPPPPPGVEPVGREETLARLSSLLGPNAERRETQKEYAVHAAHVFGVPNEAGEPLVSLAEAGTGIGKTLGYIAPASLWAEKNDGTVWLSTYTKNLQRQLDHELSRLYPDPRLKARKVVVRKGRENYLCLLNLQEISTTAASAKGRILLGLVNRWARFSRDGDMVGGDFPAWLGEQGTGQIGQLTDRRGECMYAGCAHYRKCFIEKAQRKAKKADLVIANHALVMMQSATRMGDPDLPTRYVFDEGHHLFDAADGAFSAHLSGQEGLELRRWIRGAENSKRRGRGLEGRLDDLLGDEEGARQNLEQIITAARCLPADGWHGRLMENSPFGPTEKFLGLVRAQIFARQAGRDDYHSLETPVHPVGDDLKEGAREALFALEKLSSPMQVLSGALLKKLDREADELDSATRGRLDAMSRSLTRRGDVVRGWCAMLDGIINEVAENDFVDWFELDRSQGRERDVGLHRHWIDPSKPFAETVLKQSHGALITSATLRDRLTDNHNPDVEWSMAEVRTGAAHFITPPARHGLASPFDYGVQSRIFIVNDLGRGNMDQLAAAYRELFMAAGGGALGLFTAISRLRGVYERLALPLERAHIPLFAQHVDPINVAVLVDIFREVEHSCLLGTDAVRDGVDVPGASLRLCVFDKVPWPRPTLLHKARREKFGKRTYDDLITRLRLKQAFGRLIRRADDRGVFIMLDGATPTRLLSAFPEETPVERLGLAEVIRKTREFLE